MPETFQLRRLAMVASMVALCLAVAGCLLTPGNFNSSLDIRRDGAFTFHYSGEIRVLGLVELARLREQQESEIDSFKPFCWGPRHPPGAPPAPAADATKSQGAETPLPVPTASRPGRTGTIIVTTVPLPNASGSVPGQRPCTDAEVAEQRKQWGKNKQTRADNNKRQIEQMSSLMGGIDLNSPGAAEELAARLRRQAGWNRVTDKGDGLYDVDFAASGQLTHDFVFPTVEKMPTVSPFLTIYHHSDGTVRIDAPAFVGGGSSQALSMMMAMAKMNGAGDAGSPQLSEVNGHFTLTTDAAILANNTDEGATSDPEGQRLSWTITPRGNSAPTALLRLGSAK